MKSKKEIQSEINEINYKLLAIKESLNMTEFQAADGCYDEDILIEMDLTIRKIYLTQLLSE